VVLALVAGGCCGGHTNCAEHLLEREPDAIAVLTATPGVGALLSSPILLTGGTGLVPSRACS
jgi:hypothetical protein